MTVDQKIDALDAKFDAKFDAFTEKLDAKFEKIDQRLDQYDAQFMAIGDHFVELSHKLDTLIRQMSDLPLIREDISYLKIQSARNQRSLSGINEQLIRMEEKDDYLLSRIEKIGTSEYA